METNDQNRNFTISAKVTATQKAKYIDQAKKLNLSLSEWVSGTLDMSINAYGTVNKPKSQIRQILEEISTKDNEISKISSDLETAEMDLKIKKAKILRQAKTIMELRTTNSDLPAKKEKIILENPSEDINNNKKTIPKNDILGLISGASIIFSIIALGKK